MILRYFLFFILVALCLSCTSGTSEQANPEETSPPASPEVLPGETVDGSVAGSAIAIGDASAKTSDGAGENPRTGQEICALRKADPINLSLGPNAVLLVGSEESLLLLEHQGQIKASIGGQDLLLGAVNSLSDELNYNPYRIAEAAGSGRFTPDDLTWVSSVCFSNIQENEGGFQASLVWENGDESVLEGRIETNRVHLKWNLPDTEILAPYKRMQLRGNETEGFYGMGEVLDHVNHRGLVRAMNMEFAEQESGYNEAHVPIPLLMGTTGWGVFVESYRPGVFEIATREENLTTVTFGFANAVDEALDFHLFVEDHPLDLTRHYYEITGFPGDVAPWALGPWIWRDEVSGQEKVEEDLLTIRDLDLATTGYWIDRPYATDVNSFDFDPEKYTDAQSMMDLAQSLGFEMALWHTPYVDPEGILSSELYKEAEAAGFFAPLLPTALAKWGPPLDFSNPDAVTWWQGLLEPYRDLGIKGYKLDFGEEVITGFFGKRLPSLFSDGTDEFTMHRRYSILYHEAYRPMIPEEGGFLLCRAGSFGDQVNGCIIWPGDIDATMARNGDIGIDKEGKEYISVGGLPAAIVAGSSLGPSGYPLFASDTGGYLHSPPTKECFIRWAEHTAFSPAMQVGTNTNDLPWEFGADREYDEELIGLYRTLAEVHLRLHPYLWTAWKNVQTTGRAIQRPLGLAHPEMGVHPDDIYILGDDLLVAPVVEEGALSKTVTLPGGQWNNWWTGEVIAGDATVEQDAPLGTTPVWVRSGVPIPLLRPGIETLSPTTEAERVETLHGNPTPLHVRLSPGESSQRVLHDGTELIHTDNSNSFTFSWKAGSVFNDWIVLELWGLENSGVQLLLDGDTPLEEEDGDGAGWSQKSTHVEVRLPPESSSVVISK